MCKNFHELEELDAQGDQLHCQLEELQLEELMHEAVAWSEVALTQP